jgi:hypothetical protein
MSTKRIVPPPVLPRSTVWTAERIAKLTPAEVKQLRENAERLQEPEIAELCTQSLKSRPRVVKPAGAAPKKPKPKVAVAS